MSTYSTTGSSTYTSIYTQTPPITAVPPGRVWQTHIGGRRIEIADMEDEHLLNSIAMVERGRDVDGRVIPDFCYTKLDYLKQEAIKRGLTVREDGWDV